MNTVADVVFPNKLHVRRWKPNITAEHRQQEATQRRSLAASYIFILLSFLHYYKTGHVVWFRKAKKDTVGFPLSTM